MHFFLGFFLFTWEKQPSTSYTFGVVSYLESTLYANMLEMWIKGEEIQLFL
jgi:hypothetical protein